ncbi:MAG: type II secretion system F family protein [Rhizomicrobium sp.]
MALYRYKAIAGSGAIVTGMGEAHSAALLAEQLRAQGHYPVSASEVGASSLASRLMGILRRKGRPPRRVLTTATQELASLVGAGLELDRALGTLSDLADVASLHASFEKARQSVRGGTSFSEAMEKDAAFPPLYVNMVRAGEMGGTLSTTLQRLADYLERAQTLRDAVVSALVYPAILLATAGASIVIILTFVLPEFEPLFAESGRALPWPTRAIMGTSATVRTYWWLFAPVLAAGIAGARAALRRPHLRLKLDRALLRLPLVGDLLRAMEIERFCRTLGTLAGNGVALPLALKLSSGVLWNGELRAAVDGAAKGLREGESLSRHLASSGSFPPLTLDLIQIGEETGKLDEMLLRQADLDGQRIRHRLDRLLALLVPVLTILLGFVVAGLIASMLVAILSVNDLALQ